MMRALPVLVLLACSPHDWTPPPLRVVTEKDLIARTETDGTVSVTALVTLADATAAGSVRLRHGTLEDALRSGHVRLARARAWQALGQMLAAKPEQSFDALARGHSEIYLVTESDTGNRFLAAKGALATNPSAALEMMSRVLAGDLSAYAVRFHDQIW